ncbi:beta-lactamase regulating signal transducer with metallopeptidase domain [Neolewinella xylanilytica]|uniref:Beta-lactamase regulating signal transducer with metallopeptidase domain n=1 Tax=Neolewinella xylanilytica TaxID=1514080 RepID=A0A2S6I9E6_9BACT|nr:M56 family metallopeptidase [Neolewinella xylanilytica]PPK88115.1 beta-lactamase regulating signal transducer with metallopeptidase domain [Neolewinella xylanilytica]
MVLSDIAALGTTILHSLWQATLLAGLLWLVSRNQRLTARARYGLAYATLLVQCSLSVITLLYYRAPNPHLEATVKQAVIDFVAAAPPGAVTRHLLYTPDFWMGALVSCWLLGMLVGTLRLSVSLWQSRRMQSRAVTPVTEGFACQVRTLALRMGYSGRLRLWASRLVDTPMLVGHLKPVLLFPVAMVNRLSTEESETVILHELAHLYRYDHWFNLLQCLIEVVFYYHPAVHWIGARIREEREHCCDDLVLEHGPGRLPYARALLYFSAAHSESPATLSLTDGGGLLSRVRRFVNHQEISYKMKSRLLLLPLLAVIVLVATAAYVPAETPASAESLSGNFSAPAPGAQHAATAVDTLPQGTHQVTKISDGKTTRLRVEDGKITELELDGERIPEQAFPQYEEQAEELLGIQRPYRMSRNDTVILYEPLHHRFSDSVLIYRSLSALDGIDLNFDFDFPTEALQDRFLKLQLNLDSLGKHFESLQFDGLDGEIFLDKDLELMDSVYTRSLDGLHIFRHRLENIDRIDDLDELREREKVLQKALEQLEERKQQLRDRQDVRGEAMLDQVRAARNQVLAHARHTREALQQRRHAPLGLQVHSDDGAIAWRPLEGGASIDASAVPLPNSRMLPCPPTAPSATSSPARIYTYEYGPGSSLE